MLCWGKKFRAMEPWCAHRATCLSRVLARAGIESDRRVRKGLAYSDFDLADWLLNVGIEHDL